MRVACLRPLKAGLTHGWSTMPKLRVGMPPAIFAIMPQIAKMLLKFKVFFGVGILFVIELYYSASFAFTG